MKSSKKLGRGPLAKPTDLIAYLSGLTVSQGRLAGQAFQVLPWEARFVRGTFKPGIQSAALSVARGNGEDGAAVGHCVCEPGRSARGAPWRDRDRGEFV